MRRPALEPVLGRRVAPLRGRRLPDARRRRLRRVPRVLFVGGGLRRGPRGVRAAERDKGRGSRVRLRRGGGRRGLRDGRRASRASLAQRRRAPRVVRRPLGHLAPRRRGESGRRRRVREPREQDGHALPRGHVPVLRRQWRVVAREARALARPDGDGHRRLAEPARRRRGRGPRRRRRRDRLPHPRDGAGPLPRRRRARALPGRLRRRHVARRGLPAPRELLLEHELPELPALSRHPRRLRVPLFPRVY
mmetsp:Transcript_22668/g.77998  ORF Transcript_22668/g.77998 Transcript_22668/m.77998 type:complete len:249 (+) Transcript_22668:627-1373(+)